MQETFEVISHFFAGIICLLIFILIMLFKKGTTFHKSLGKIFILIYLYLISIGLIAGAKYKFFDDLSLKAMLWLQALYSLSIIILGLSFAKKRSRIESLRKINILLQGFVLLVAIIVLLFSIVKLQSVSICFSSLIVFMLFKNIFFLVRCNQKPYYLFIHVSAKFTLGVLLTFNATGFYGIHAVYDELGMVPWLQALKSFSLITAIIVLFEYNYINKFLKN